MTTSIEDLIPQTGFLGDYIATAREQIMAPVEFHLAAGLAAISTAIGRGVRFKLGGWRYPTIWQIVLAPAGAGKSSAVSPLHDTIERVRGKDARLASRFSQEAFYEAASNAPDGLWSIGEIGGLLGNMQHKYMTGFAEDLCDVWDHTTMRRKTRKDDQKVENPAITVIATGRHTDFTDQTGLEQFTSGLMSRFIVYTTNEPPAYRGLLDQDRHTSNPMVQESLDSYLEDLDRLRNLPRPIPAEITPEAIERWEADDRSWHLELAGGSVPRHLEGFAKRRGIQALKLAVLHALSRHDKPTVLADDAAWGCLLAQRSYEVVEGLTAGGKIGLDKYARQRQEIFDKARTLAARRHGIVTVRELLRACGHHLRNKADAEGLLGLWIAAGTIQRGGLKPTTGRPADAIRILELNVAPPPEWIPQQREEVSA